MGENPKTGDYATQDRITTGPGGVMDRTATRVGQGFDDVASRTNITPDETNNIITKLAHIDGTLDLEAGLTDAAKAAIRRNIDLVQNAAVKGNGSISGADYQALTLTKGAIDRLASNPDPNVSAIGMQIKHVIDDGFQASASEADKATLSQLRYQWRLMKTVQPLAEEAQGASIDPGKFASRVVAASRKLDGSTGGIAYTGGGTIGELGKIGNLISRAPAPAQSSLMADIVHPSVGGVLLAERYPALAAGVHAAQVVGRRLAGPYARSGLNAEDVLTNALYRPTLLGGALRRRHRRRHGQSVSAASALAPIKANVSLVTLVDDDARQPDENDHPDAGQRVVQRLIRETSLRPWNIKTSNPSPVGGSSRNIAANRLPCAHAMMSMTGEGPCRARMPDQNVHYDNSLCVERRRSPSNSLPSIPRIRARR